MRQRAVTGWYDNELARLRFEHRAKLLYPDLRRTFSGRGLDRVIVYRLRVELPEYETREIQLELNNFLQPHLHRVLADGPTDSPHRYDEHQLCLWHPKDEQGEAWLPKDGLLALIEHTRIHLWKEAWWRETGEWLGPEYPHPPTDEKAA